MAALDISAMMWHIICGHIEGGTLPLSGESDLDAKLIKIYDLQKNLGQEQFLLGRLLGDFLPVAKYQRDRFEEQSYYKIWIHINSYVCSVWRTRCELVSLKLQNSEKFLALGDVDTILNSNDVTFVTSGNKSLLSNCPDTSWNLKIIQS